MLYTEVAPERLVLEDQARRQAQALDVSAVNLEDSSGRTGVKGLIIAPHGLADQRFSYALNVTGDNVIQMSIAAVPKFVEPTSPLVTEPETREGNRWFDTIRRGPFPRQVEDQLSIRRGRRNAAVVIEVAVDEDTGKPTLVGVDSHAYVTPMKQESLVRTDGQRSAVDGVHWVEIANHVRDWRLAQGALSPTDESGARLSATGHIAPNTPAAPDYFTRAELLHAVGLAAAADMHQTATPAAFLTQDAPGIGLSNRQVVDLLEGNLHQSDIDALDLRPTELTTDSNRLHHGYAGRYVSLAALSNIAGYANLANLVAEKSGRELPFDAQRMKQLVRRQNLLKGLQLAEIKTGDTRPLNRDKINELIEQTTIDPSTISNRTLRTIKRWASLGYLLPSHTVALLTIDADPSDENYIQRLIIAEAAMQDINHYPRTSKGVLKRLATPGLVNSFRTNTQLFADEVGDSILGTASVVAPDSRVLKSVASGRDGSTVMAQTHTELVNQVVDAGYHKRRAG